MKRLRLVLLATCLCFASMGSAVACPSADTDEVTSVYGTSSRRDAWAYYKLSDPSRDFDVNYVPRPADYASARFMGFVRTPADGAWGGGEFLCCDNTYYIFRTTVKSPRRLVIPLVLGGDDGHALVVDGQVVGGGGFASAVIYDLVVPAHKRVTIEVAGFNAGGPWVFELRRRDTGENLLSTAGLRVRAPKVRRGHHTW